MPKVLINGLGRSGTSWVLKTFDHHPSVFSSFEPETIVTAEEITRMFFANNPKGVEEYIERIFSSRHLRAMRKRPILGKTYRSFASHSLRVAYIYALSGLEKLPGFGDKLLQVSVPDMTKSNKFTQVVKAVSDQFLLPQIAEKSNDLKIIYLVRHPCGQINSHISGIAAGKMALNFLPPREIMDQYFEFEQPTHNLMENDFSDIEVAAYRWACSTELNYRALSGNPNALLVRYEDICENPIAEFKAMFDWAGLNWSEHCEIFLKKSLAADVDGTEYHSLVRSPAIAANKWRKAMKSEDIETVLSICSKANSFIRLYPDGTRISDATH